MPITILTSQLRYDNVTCFYRNLDTSFLRPEQDRYDWRARWTYLNASEGPAKIDFVQFQVTCYDKQTNSMVSRRAVASLFCSYKINVIQNVAVMLVVRIMCPHFQVVMDRAFAHVLPKHIPSKTIASNDVDLSVDVMVLESVSIVQMRRQMPLLTQIISNDPNWYV